MKTNEVDTRKQILQSILSSPHGELIELAKLHNAAFTDDPDFYQHFACWYEDKGSIRDHKNLFAGRLLTSNIYYQMRPVGRALLLKQPARACERTIKVAKELFKGAPRFLKTTVEYYLRKLEGNSKAFDRAVMQNRKSLKYLYASLHIKPADRAQKILFDNLPPEGSDIHAIKKLHSASPQEAAELIVRYSIPYLTAVGAVSQITPTVSIALINSMTPQQLLNNLKAIEKKGLLEDADVKALVEGKIAAAKTDNRVATLKMDKAGEKVQEFSKQIKEVRDSKIADTVEITKDTAIFIDKSGSMELAIEVGKRIAAMVSAVIKAKLIVIAFDSSAKLVGGKLANEAGSMTKWENAFRLIKAAGSTSIGSAMRLLAKVEKAIEQIIIVTDEGENHPPHFVEEYETYSAKPEVIVVSIGGGEMQFRQSIKNINHTIFTFDGDYYSLPNLLPMLAGQSYADLVMEIMEYPLAA